MGGKFSAKTPVKWLSVYLLLVSFPLGFSKSVNASNLSGPGKFLSPPL
jgi:hypothetical protein